MKPLALTLAFAALAAAPAAAHDLGGAHSHPHVDPLLTVGALLALGLAVAMAWARSR